MVYWMNDLCLQAVEDKLLLGGFEFLEILCDKRLISGRNKAILLEL